MINEVSLMAIHRYGSVSQIQQTIQELAELIQAITKHTLSEPNTDQGRKAYVNVIEEMADVEIMLEQLKFILDIDYATIEDVKMYKQLRLKNRLEMESLANNN